MQLEKAIQIIGKSWTLDCPTHSKPAPISDSVPKKKKIPTAGLYYQEFGSWSSSPLFFKEVMAPRKWAPKRRFSVVHVGRWLHETLWKWWWSPWGWPLFSLRDRPHHHCAAVCIGGKEGICWLIILNSVYLNLYCPEKVTWLPLNCLFACLFDLGYGFFGRPADHSSHLEADPTTTTEHRWEWGYLLADYFE